MRNQRIRNILAAGALTGLVLLTMIAFGWQSLSANEASAEQTAPAGATTTESSPQAENEQLRQAVDTLQQREAAYQSQIEAANQTILQLQSDSSGRATYEDDDDWYEDDDEHEYEEHEDDDEEHEREHDDD